MSSTHARPARTMLRRGAIGAALSVAVGLPLLSVAPAALAAATDTRTPVKLTLVARSCDSYADITANRARNNIQETLQDLGADTLYSSGEDIAVDKEKSGQPTCVPLNDWQFEFGSGYTGKPNVPGGLSTTKGGGDDIATVTDKTATVDELDVNGQPTGRRIDGAVTVDLTAAQFDLARKANAFWVQGGLRTDPLMKSTFGDAYAFGALRAAIDNLNGDNVEWVQLKNGQKHAFVYAYYVSPPPGAGQIVVKKTVEGQDPAGSTSFVFDGNVSYDPSGTFSLKNGGSVSFDRAAIETPWVVEERQLLGWSLEDVVVDVKDLDKEAVDSSVIETATGVSIVLADRERVTVTFVNKAPVKPTIEIREMTLGNVGTFGFAVDGPATEDFELSATTTVAGDEISAAPARSVSPGGYAIAQTAPTTPGGTWELVDVIGDGVTLDPEAGVATLDWNATGVVTFVNEWVPDPVDPVDPVGPVDPVDPGTSPTTPTEPTTPTKPEVGVLSQSTTVPSAQAGPLAFTGTDSAVLAGLGLVAVALGGLLVLITRKRSTTAS